MSSSVDNSSQYRFSVVLIGAILIAGSILSVVDPENLRAGSLLPIAAAALFSLAALRIGAWINRGDLEEDFAVGCLVLSLWPIALHHLGLLREIPLAVPVLLVAPLGMAPATRRGIRSAAHAVAKVFSASDLFGHVVLLLGCFGLLWAFLSTLAPPAGMDALTYHLGLGVQYLARGSLTPPDTVHYYQYTQAGEMTALMGLALDRSGIASNIILGLFLPFTALAAARGAGELIPVARPESGAERSTARIIAFGVTSTSAMLLFVVSHTKTDIFALFLFLLAIRRLMPSTFSAPRAALLLGASLAVKVTAIYGVLPALFLLGWATWNRKIIWPMLAILIATFPSYWWIRNLLQFGTVMPQSGHVASSAAGAIGAPMLERLFRIVASFFLFIDQGIDGPLGAGFAAVTVAVILAIFSRRTEYRILGAVTACSVALWFITGGGSHAYAKGGLFRFVMPALGAAIVGGSAFMAEGFSRLKTALARSLMRIGFCVALASSLFLAVRIHTTYQPFLAYLCGDISIEDYMKNWSSSWKIQQEGNRMLPANAKVLSIGESRLFYLGRNASFEFDADLPRIFSAMHDTSYRDDTAVVEHIADWMRREGFTHILHAPDWYAVKIVVGLAPPPLRYGDRAILERYLAAHTTLVAGDTEKNVFLHAINGVSLRKCVFEE